jgi:hypothetical protein
MTTLELFKKHRKGEVSRDRFLYEVRRDNNLPWVTNTTSYDDAVKILKNKGIIRESAVTPENTLTSPAADRVNPYFLKKGIEKELENKADLNNNSYEEALNKAANKLAKDPHAFDDLLIHNASDIHKKDEKLKTREVKKGNHVDKDNGMKKMKGQETPKAMSAPTKENKKGKPKGVKVMPDKGVEGSQKIIKEISEYLKKKLTLSESNPYHDFHEGMTIPMEEGEGIVKEINGGTLCVEMPDGSLKDIQMNHAKNLIEKSKEEQHEKETGLNQKYESGFKATRLEEDEDQKKYTVTVSLRTARKANEVIDNLYRESDVEKLYPDVFVINGEDVFEDLMKNFEGAGIEIEKIEDSGSDDEEDDNFGYDQEMDEAVYDVTGIDLNTGARRSLGTFKSGQGKKIAQDLKSKGASSVQVNTIA